MKVEGDAQEGPAKDGCQAQLYCRGDCLEEEDGGGGDHEGDEDGGGEDGNDGGFVVNEL